MDFASSGLANLQLLAAVLRQQQQQSSGAAGGVQQQQQHLQQPRNAPSPQRQQQNLNFETYGDGGGNWRRPPPAHHNPFGEPGLGDNDMRLLFPSGSATAPVRSAHIYEGDESVSSKSRRQVVPTTTNNLVAAEPIVSSDDEDDGDGNCRKAEQQQIEEQKQRHQKQQVEQQLRQQQLNEQQKKQLQIEQQKKHQMEQQMQQQQEKVEQERQQQQQAMNSFMKMEHQQQLPPNSSNLANLFEVLKKLSASSANSTSNSGTRNQDFTNRSVVATEQDEEQYETPPFVKPQATSPNTSYEMYEKKKQSQLLKLEANYKLREAAVDENRQRSELEKLGIQIYNSSNDTAAKKDEKGIRSAVAPVNSGGCKNESDKLLEQKKVINGQVSELETKCNELDRQQKAFVEELNKLKKDHGILCRQVQRKSSVNRDDVNILKENTDLQNDLEKKIELTNETKNNVQTMIQNLRKKQNEIEVLLKKISDDKKESIKQKLDKEMTDLKKVASVQKAKNETSSSARSSSSSSRQPPDSTSRYKDEYKSRSTSDNSKSQPSNNKVTSSANAGAESAKATAKAKEISNAKFLNTVYFDGGSHWCKKCNIVSASVYECFEHLHSTDHKSTLDMMDRPWMPDHLKTAQKQPELNNQSQMMPFKGVEFLTGCSGFYCSLCREFSGDAVCAEDHLKSITHNKNYANLIENNPYHEQCYNLEKMASLVRRIEQSNVPIDKLMTSSSAAPAVGGPNIQQQAQQNEPLFEKFQKKMKETVFVPPMVSERPHQEQQTNSLPNSRASFGSQQKPHIPSVSGKVGPFKLKSKEEIQAELSGAKRQPAGSASSAFLPYGPEPPKSLSTAYVNKKIVSKWESGRSRSPSRSRSRSRSRKRSRSPRSMSRSRSRSRSRRRSTRSRTRSRSRSRSRTPEKRPAYINHRTRGAPFFPPQRGFSRGITYYPRGSSRGRPFQR